MVDSPDKKQIVTDLMNTFGNAVWNYAYSIARKREHADDITQEVFIKVFRNLHTFRSSDSSIKAWLLTITRNSAYDFLRKSFFRRVILIDNVESDTVYQSAEEELMDKLTITDIWKKVMRLPAKFREVLILYGHHQLSMKEIALILSISESAVKSRLHQARLRMVKMKERE
jgi:RNA polymerase sigma-70 factor (ECF subfamily)